MHARRKKPKLPKHVLRHFGRHRVISRIDPSFDLIGDMAELATEISEKPFSEARMSATIDEKSNICIAAYIEGDKVTPRELEGFLVAGLMPDSTHRIIIISLRKEDDTVLLHALLDWLKSYVSGAIRISIDMNQCAAYRELGFVVSERVGRRYEMLHR